MALIGTDGRRPFRPTSGPSPTDLALLALGLLVAFAVLYPLSGSRFPVGPDAPVYLWWARAASADGLSVVGYRAGGPALSLVLSGSLPLTLEQAVAGLGPALAAATGLAAAAMVGAAGAGRAAALLAGALAGAHTAHLAGGYTANLVVVPTFLAAVAVLTASPRDGLRGPVAAAALLGAAGLSHAPFAALGAGILAVVAGVDLVSRLRRRRERTTPATGDGGPPPPEGLMASDVGRVAVAVGGGGVVAAAGLASLAAGPDRFPVDTSKDAFVRRVGWIADLAEEYRARFAKLWLHYVPPLSVPLAAWGAWVMPTGSAAGRRPAAVFARRVLLTWLVVTVAGVPLAWVTGTAPPVRVLGFAYVLPVGAALGIVALHRRLAGPRPKLAMGIAALLAAAMVAGPAWAWGHQSSLIHDDELPSLHAAARVAAALPEDTPLVLLVENDDPHIGFLATLAGNVFRAAVPPERIDDVHLAVGAPSDFLRGEPTVRGNAVHDEMSRVYLADLAGVDGPAVTFVLEPFNARFGDDLGDRAVGCGPGVKVLLEEGEAPDACAEPAQVDPVLRPFAPWSIFLTSPLVLVTLLLAGYGWSRAALGRGSASLALAPAFGLASLVLAAFLLDRLGIRLDGRLAASVALLLPSAGGYLVALRFERHAVA